MRYARLVAGKGTMSLLLRVDYADGLEGDRSFFNDLLSMEFKRAKKQREEMLYDDHFKMRITLVGPTWQRARLPFVWTSSDEKREMMAKVAYLARAMEAKGVLITSDARFIMSEDFTAHFKMEAHTAENSKVWMEEYDRIMKRYDYEMVNLPRHVWRETILVALKTPQFGDEWKTQPYTKSGNRIMWLPVEEGMEGASVETKMLRNWWTIPEDDPNLKITRGVAAVLLSALELGLA
jgi:hypothetical protein